MIWKRKIFCGLGWVLVFEKNFFVFGEYVFFIEVVVFVVVLMLIFKSDLKDVVDFMYC